MKTDVEKAIEVDAYVLEWSGLKKDKRGYNALLQLLHTGVLMNDRLGEDDTVDLCKILIRLTLRFEFISGGFTLSQNAKINFYHSVMYPPKVKPVYTQNYHNRLGKDDPEEGKQGWADRQLSQKKK